MRAAAGVAAVQGGSLALLGVGYAVDAVVGHPDNRVAALLTAALSLLAGALFGALARAVNRRRGWARSPLVVLELLALPVGVGLAQGGVWLLAAAVLGSAAVVLYLLATPPARAAFRG